MNVVAEGVVTIEQFTLIVIANNQYDLIRGCYYSKPLPGEYN